MGELENFKMIEKLILGKLGDDEVDQLWIEFLKDRELFDCFLIELHWRSMGYQAKKKVKKS